MTQILRKSPHQIRAMSNPCNLKPTAKKIIMEIRRISYDMKYKNKNIYS